MKILILSSWYWSNFQQYWNFTINGVFCAKWFCNLCTSHKHRTPCHNIHLQNSKKTNRSRPLGCHQSSWLIAQDTPLCRLNIDWWLHSESKLMPEINNDKQCQGWLWPAGPLFLAQTGTIPTLTFLTVVPRDEGYRRGGSGYGIKVR